MKLNPTKDHRRVMKQFVWALGGISTAAVAWIIFNQNYRHRRVPVTKAAELLQHAWANYHTEA